MQWVNLKVKLRGIRKKLPASCICGSAWRVTSGYLVDDYYYDSGFMTYYEVFIIPINKYYGVFCTFDNRRNEIYTGFRREFLEDIEKLGLKCYSEAINGLEMPKIYQFEEYYKKLYGI